MYLSTKNQRLETQNWFETLRDQICSSFEKLEQNYEGPKQSMLPGKFRRKKWHREGGEEEEKCQLWRAAYSRRLVSIFPP